MILFAFKTQFGHASSQIYMNTAYSLKVFLDSFYVFFQMALFSFVGIEMIGVTAGETKDPLKQFQKQLTVYPLEF